MGTNPLYLNQLITVNCVTSNLVAILTDFKLTLQIVYKVCTASEYESTMMKTRNRSVGATHNPSQYPA